MIQREPKIRVVIERSFRRNGSSVQAVDAFVGLRKMGRASLGQAYRWALVVVMDTKISNVEVPVRKGVR